MELVEDGDNRKNTFSDNQNGDLKRPIDMTVPERIGLYSSVRFVRPILRCKTVKVNGYFCIFLKYCTEIDICNI